MQIKNYVLQSITALLLASPIGACTLGGASDQSALSGKDGGGADGDCTFTQGYWKNHPDAWPVSSLKLGSVTYDKVELIAILKTPVKGNGLVQLAHQLIAAKLNIANGADDADIAAAVAQADALIGSLVVPPGGDGELETRVTSALNDTLDAFNNGNLGPGHCDKNDDDGGGDDCDHDDDGDCDEGDCDHDHDGDCDEGDCDHDDDGDCDGDDGNTCDHGDCDHDDDGDCDGDGSGSCDHDCDAPAACGDGVMEGLELCDDGNTTNGDGCSSTCTIELPVCGNGVIEVGETCDDGNTHDGDGCSSVCVCEPC